MHTIFSRFVFAISIVFAAASYSYGYELKTDYATITYEKEDQLRQFNKKLSLGSLSYLVKNRQNFTVKDEVRTKLDAVVERVEKVLEMFPRDVNFKVMLLSTDSDVQNVYKKLYGSKVDYISFYAPRDKTVYISVDDIRIGVLAHELAHLIMDLYFGVSPPTKIHEVLAQFVETHLTD